MKRIRIGMVGISGMGRGHLEAISRSKKVELVAVSEIQSKILKEVSQKYKIPGFKNYQDMFKKIPMDGVLLVLPHHLYPEVIKTAIRYKVHILKEKPLARNYREAKKMVEQVDKAGLILMITTQRQYHDIFSRVKNYLPKIGNVFLVRAEFIFYWNTKSMGWRGIKKLSGGGTLIDMGYHVVDMLVSNLGLPDEVYGYHEDIGAPKIPHDTEDTSVVIFRYKKGATGYLLNSWVTNPSTDFISFHGTKGILSADWQGLKWMDQNGKLIKEIKSKQDWIKALQNQVEHFADCIRLNNKPLTSAKSNLVNMAFIEAAYKSYTTRRPESPHQFIKY